MWLHSHLEYLEYYLCLIQESSLGPINRKYHNTFLRISVRHPEYCSSYKYVYIRALKIWLLMKFHVIVSRYKYLNFELLLWCLKWSNVTSSKYISDSFALCKRKRKNSKEVGWLYWYIKFSAMIQSSACLRELLCNRAP